MTQINYRELAYLTPAFANEIREKGYLDTTDIHPDDVLQAVESDAVIRWRGVVMVINVKHRKSPYNTIVLNDKHQIFKLRQTINQLMGKLRREFKLDYRFDTKMHANHASIRRQIPFICHDFWLMAVGRKRGNNYSWFRWYYNQEPWDHRGQETLVTYAGFVPLLLPHSRRGIVNRQNKCYAMARSIAEKNNETVPTCMQGLKQDNSTTQNVQHCKTLDEVQINMILGKVLSKEQTRQYRNRIIDELHQGNFSQLDETVDPDAI